MPRRSHALGRLVFDAKRPGDHVLVYRLEDARGRGLYSTNVRTKAEEYALADPRLRGEWNEEALDYDYSAQPQPAVDFVPSEWRDLPASEQRRFLFGFPDEASVRRWFGPLHLRLFEQFGMRVVQRKARTVFLSKSKRQLIFLPLEGD